MIGICLIYYLHNGKKNLITIWFETEQNYMFKNVTGGHTRLFNI